MNCSNSVHSYCFTRLRVMPQVLEVDKVCRSICA